MNLRQDSQWPVNQLRLFEQTYLVVSIRRLGLSGQALCISSLCVVHIFVNVPLHYLAFKIDVKFAIINILPKAYCVS